MRGVLGLTGLSGRAATAAHGAAIYGAAQVTLPALEIVKLWAAEHGKDDRQFDFVYFLDAKEKSEQTFVSTEAEFIKTTTRAKWSFALD